MMSQKMEKQYEMHTKFVILYAFIKVFILPEKEAGQDFMFSFMSN